MLNKKHIQEIVKAVTGVYVAWQSILEFQAMHAKSRYRAQALKDEVTFWNIINSNDMS